MTFPDDYRRRSRLFHVALVSVLWSASLAAQPSSGPCSDMRTVPAGIAALEFLNQLSFGRCLGGDADPDPLRRTARKLIDSVPGADSSSDEERRLIVFSVLDPVLEALDAEVRRLPDSDRARALLAAIRDSIVVARAAVTAGLEVDSVRLLQAGTWRWDPAVTRFGALGADIAGLVSAACVTPASTPCAAALHEAQLSLRSAHLVERAMMYYARRLLVAALAHATMRDARWNAYFEETLVQYPWELAINSWRFSRVARASNGFALPPSNQLIFLHPMAGLEYIGSSVAGSRLEPAVGLEVLGFNRWSWSRNNAPNAALGLSLVAAYSDRQGVDELGYGVLIRYAHRYALAATFRDKKVGVLLSSQLGDWIAGKQQKAKDAMRMFGRGG
jgi:hypothetical protein